MRASGRDGGEGRPDVTDASVAPNVAPAAGRTPAGLLAGIVAAVVGVAVAAQVSVPVPGSPVPQSLQTLAVVLVGAFLGVRAGVVALVLYVVAGAFGLPVFADGAGGVGHLTGPTVGYLVGFVLAAAFMGWWVRRGWTTGLSVEPAAGTQLRGAAWLRRLAGTFVGALLAHAIILGLGWARLALLLCAGEAWSSGVGPFVVGGLAKSVVAAVVWTALDAAHRGRQDSSWP